VTDSEPEEIGEGSAGIVELVGEDMKGEAEGEADRPGIGEEKNRRRPEKKGDFPGVDEEEVLSVLVVMGGAKELSRAEALHPEGVGIFENMVEVDEDPGEEKGHGSGERPEEEVDQPRADESDCGVVMESDSGSPVEIGGSLSFN